MRTLLFTLLIAITSGAQIIEITNTVTGTSDTVDLQGRDLNLVFMYGITNEVVPQGWYERYYLESECEEYGLPLSYTNKVWWCHTEDAVIDGDTPYMYIDAWESEGEYDILFTADLNTPWYTIGTITNENAYANTLKVHLPINSPAARRALYSDRGFVKLSTWNTNCVFSVDPSDIYNKGYGDPNKDYPEGGGGNGGGPPPLPVALRYCEDKK